MLSHTRLGQPFHHHKLNVVISCGDGLQMLPPALFSSASFLATQCQMR